jgi:SRSO17 transposase
MSIFKVSIEKQTYRSKECLIQRKNSKNYGKTLAGSLNRLDKYLADYQHNFKNSTKKFFDKAEQYSHGIFLSSERNIERICEAHDDPAYHKMHHFISDSNWNAGEVVDQAAIQVSGLLPGRKLTGLIIDETGVLKKGDKSVGVGWQYCGNVGKTANCQVAVVACLNNGDFASLVDARLYLPQDWCEDPVRCEEAKIPEDQGEFKTKAELAYEIISHQLELGVKFDYAGADGFYGNDPDLADKLEDLGCIYMLDIHCNQQVFFEKPEYEVPTRKGTRGKTPTVVRPNKPSIRVDQYYKTLKAKDWIKVTVRNTAKGKLKGEYHFCQVWVENKVRNSFEKRLLVIRKVKTKKGFEIKFSFTNADLVQYTEKGIAYMQAQRFFVEHSIKESKKILGMSQYQTRKWLVWQHQVALNIMIS